MASEEQDPAGAGAEEQSSTAAFEHALYDPGTVFYVLKLYVAGTAPRSLRAITNTRSLCEGHLAGQYDLEVIDIYQQPALPEGARILAVPALVKTEPPPQIWFIGEMSDSERILTKLGVRTTRAVSVEHPPR